jgi:hypothetical protein
MKMKRISKEKALELMTNNKGRFFTATFIKKNGEERTINGKYKSVSKLGYVKIAEHNVGTKEAGRIRNVNLQTIKALKIGGQLCKVA